MEDQNGHNLSLSEVEKLRNLLERVSKLEDKLDKINEESFDELRKSIKLEDTLEGLSKATVESRAERQELREEIKNMNTMLRTTLTDTLTKMVEFSNKQSSDTMNDAFKDKEFLKRLIIIFATALVTVVLGALGIKALIPL